MPHDQLAAGVPGRQRHNQGSDHRIGFLGVLVGEGVLVLLIHQQGMKIGGQLGSVRKPKLLSYRRKDDPQRGIVPLGADEIPRDLPRVADVRVGQRLPAAAEPGRPPEAERLAGPRGRHREFDGPEALDLQSQVVRPRRQLHAERGLRVAA
jgi:hypothetical protein